MRDRTGTPDGIASPVGANRHQSRTSGNGEDRLKFTIDTSPSTDYLSL